MVSHKKTSVAVRTRGWSEIFFLFATTPRVVEGTTTFPIFVQHAGPHLTETRVNLTALAGIEIRILCMEAERY